MDKALHKLVTLVPPGPLWGVGVAGLVGGLFVAVSRCPVPTTRWAIAALLLCLGVASLLAARASQRARRAFLWRLIQAQAAALESRDPGEVLPLPQDAPSVELAGLTEAITRVALARREALRGWAVAEQDTVALLQADQQAERDRLRQKVRDRTFERQVLMELSKVFERTLDEGDLLRSVSEHLPWVLSHDLSASVVLADDSGRGRVLVRPARPLAEGLVVSVVGQLAAMLEDEGLPGATQLISSCAVQVLPPLSRDGEPVARIESLLLVPSRMGKDVRQVTGAVLVAAEMPDAFAPAERRLLRKVVAHAGATARRLRSLLEAEQARIRAVLAQLPVGVVLLDEDGVVQLTNPAGWQALAMLGGGLRGRPESLGGVPLAELFVRACEGEGVQLRGEGGGGFSVTAARVDLGEAGPGYVLVIRDVTEERERQARAEEQARLAAVGQLAAGIAHDFNNLLTTVIGTAELLQMTGAVHGPALEDLSAIGEQGRRAAGMIRQILDFSRERPGEARRVDLPDLVGKSLALLGRVLPEDIALGTEMAPGPIYVRADPAQIDQVLTNLVVNARDALPDGGRIHVRVVHSARPVKGGGSAAMASAEYEVQPAAGARPAPPPEGEVGCLLEVRDDGVGMPPEVARRIFEPFFSTKPTGQGTGLGLAQVYGIVRAHGGEVTVESEPGVCTVFRVWLPVDEVAADGAVEAQEGSPRAASGGGQTVLVVEDDPRVRAVLVRQVRELGYETLEATDGAEALALLDGRDLGAGASPLWGLPANDTSPRAPAGARPDVDLVLSDVTMPRMGGIELARALQTRDPPVPVILITGYPIGALPARLEELGVAALLRKPVEVAALGEVLSDAVEETS